MPDETCAATCSLSSAIRSWPYLMISLEIADSSRFSSKVSALVKLSYVAVEYEQRLLNSSTILKAHRDAASFRAATPNQDKWQPDQAETEIGLSVAFFFSASNPVRSPVHPQFWSLQVTRNRN
jgi:hypothetical protein